MQQEWFVIIRCVQVYKLLIKYSDKYVNITIMINSTHNFNKKKS